VKRLLKTAAALTTLVTPAATADAAFPKDMARRLAPRRHQLRARRLRPREDATGFEWVESGCRASSIRKLTPELYDVQYNCEGEGEKWGLCVQLDVGHGGNVVRGPVAVAAVRAVVAVAWDTAAVSALPSP
jgi:hypothetical protein